MSYRWVQLAVGFAGIREETMYTTNKTLQHMLYEYLFWNMLKLFIIRPHHSTMYADAAYCYRVAWFVWHTSEICKNGWTDSDAVWVEDSGGPRELCVRWKSRSPCESGNFGGGAAYCKVHELCKNTGNDGDVICDVDNGLMWASGTMC